MARRQSAQKPWTSQRKSRARATPTSLRAIGDPRPSRAPLGVPMILRRERAVCRLASTPPRLTSSRTAPSAQLRRQIHSMGGACLAHAAIRACRRAQPVRNAARRRMLVESPFTAARAGRLSSASTISARELRRRLRRLRRSRLRLRHLTLRRKTAAPRLRATPASQWEWWFWPLRS
jgi:hypothetical protein